MNLFIQVSAEDKGTGNREKIVITNDQNRLTPDDIERMIKDAEKFADDDKKLKERVEARNELESYAYSLKNQLADKEKLGAKVRLEDSQEETGELLYRISLPTHCILNSLSLWGLYPLQQIQRGLQCNW
jgi:molecular chaperone DnaK (HSP70)